VGRWVGFVIMLGRCRLKLIPPASLSAGFFLVGEGLESLIGERDGGEVVSDLVARFGGYGGAWRKHGVGRSVACGCGWGGAW